jgi:hypothetical protein
VRPSPRGGRRRTVREPSGPWTATAAAVGHAPRSARWWRIVAAAVAVVGAMSLGPAVPGRGEAPARQALVAYARAAEAPASLRGALWPSFEVGLGPDVYGPPTGRAVPWRAVAAWVSSHPVVGVVGIQDNQGWRFAVLRVRDGWAYLLFAPDGRLAKLYLSTTPEDWD